MAILNKGLIVSCQAVEGEPLYNLRIMHHFARAAVEGGAVGIRANGVSDIIDIQNEVNVPIIGLIKKVYSDSDVYITPTLKEVKELIQAGCKVIALDATNRKRPNNVSLFDLVDYIRKNHADIEIMADCSTLDEARKADELGFDYIGSTMRGYTEYTRNIKLPDIGFIQDLVKTFPKTKIIAEGGIWEVNDLKKIWDSGVYAVVIGSAITRPKDITIRYNKEIN